MKVLLIVLDGWGLREGKKGNAAKLGKTPNFDYLWKNYPHTTLKASGEAVGLPKGTLGGSEVGHLHIGAGRIIKQKLTEINESIKDGTFYKKKELKNIFKKCKSKGSCIHFMGLLSDAGVHSDVRHLFALLRAAKKNGLKKDQVKIHCFLDGRDTPPKSAKKYLDSLNKEIKKFGGQIATISGRYYSMDRDKRWHRTGRAYDAIVYGRGNRDENYKRALEKAYERGETDEFVKPTVMECYNGMEKDDCIVMFNFRPDRMRQIAFMLFKINKKIVSMTKYSKELKTKVLFAPDFVDVSLGEILSKSGLSQLRIAESEKEPHVTYFFNGQRGNPFKNEKEIIIPSPKVPTYDIKPEMSAYEVTEKLLNEYRKNYDFILLNFANGDMVGHTGILKAGISATEAVDFCLGRIVHVFSRKYTIIVTADHGNCEDMRKESKFHTSHTLNKVPFILVDDYYKGKKLRSGGLSNIAPTVLKIMGIRKPKIMEKSLL